VQQLADSLSRALFFKFKRGRALRKSRIMGLAVAAVVTAATASITLAGGVANATTGSDQCAAGGGNFCIWSGPNYTGQFAQMNPHDSSTWCSKMPFQAISISNQSDVTVATYHDSTCSTSGEPVYPGQSFPGGDYANSNSPW
jgi:hypothetical protein